MTLVFRAYNHNFAVSFDNLALVAHGFYRRSYFHNILLDSIICFYPNGQFLLRHVILPLVKSYGLISSLTLSPSIILI